MRANIGLGTGNHKASSVERTWQVSLPLLSLQGANIREYLYFVGWHDRREDIEDLLDENNVDNHLIFNATILI